MSINNINISQKQNVRQFMKNILGTKQCLLFFQTSKVLVSNINISKRRNTLVEIYFDSQSQKIKIMMFHPMNTY